MITAKIRDPQSKHPFMEFIHGTTCIVGAPHGAESELWVSADSACTLVIEAAGRELKVMTINPPGTTVRLSELQQPLVRHGSGLIHQAWAALWRTPLKEDRPQRLYNFRAMIENGTAEQRGELLATFDFHLLCEVDFHWARAYHLELNDRQEGEAGSVAQRAEGTCPACHEVRARLQKDWRYET